MTTTVRLAPGGSADVPAGAVQVEWLTVEGGGGSVDLRAERVDGQPAPGLERLGEGRLLLRAVPGPVVLRACSRGGGALPAGTRLRLTLTVQQQATSVARVVLEERDVSGTEGEEQVRVAPDRPGTLQVVAAGAIAQSARLPDDPEALRVAYACRRVSRPPSPDGQRRRLVVALDLSASMLAHIRSGAVRSLLALGVGVAAVLDHQAVVPVYACGHTPLQLSDLDEAGLDGYAERAVAEHGVSVESSTAALLAGPLSDAGPETAVLHLTDGVPPDLPALLAGLGGPSPGSWHLLALAQTGADTHRSAGPWQDDLGALRAAPDGGPLHWAAVTPDEAPAWLTQRLSDERRLDDLLTRLALFPRGAR